MSENINSKIQAYRDSVCLLSYDLSLLALMAERVKRKELTDVKYTKAALAEVETDRRRFLDARAALGLDAGQEALAAFTEDHLFDGFSIRGSRFEGDRKSAGRVCGEWIGDMTEPPTEEKATRFEYGCYILMLSGSAQMVFPQTVAGRERVRRSHEWLYSACRRLVTRHRNVREKKERGSFNEKTKN